MGEAQAADAIFALDGSARFNATFYPLE